MANTDDPLAPWPQSPRTVLHRTAPITSDCAPQVLDGIRSAGLGEYVEAFVKNDIDGTRLQWTQLTGTIKLCRMPAAVAHAHSLCTFLMHIPHAYSLCIFLMHIPYVSYASLMHQSLCISYASYASS